MAYKTRELLIKQRTMSVNALRGHLAEFGVIAAKGISHVEELVESCRRGPSGDGPGDAGSSACAIAVSRRGDRRARARDRRQPSTRSGQPAGGERLGAGAPTSVGRQRQAQGRVVRLAGQAQSAETGFKVVAVALANKLARIVWAIITTGEAFRTSIYAKA